MAAGSAHGAPATGMKESAARTDAAAVPAVAETAASGAKTVETALLADPVPETATQPPGAPHGNTEARVAAAKEAATAETSVAATAATTPLANEAEATAGEVAGAADGSAVTPAEAVTAITSHLLTRFSPKIFECLFISHNSRSHHICRKMCLKVNLICCK